MRKYTDKLGAIYTKEKTNFKLWTPFAKDVILNTYSNGVGDNLIKSYQMKQNSDCVFECEISGDNHGLFYDYSITVDEKTYIAHDPYAIACGVNSSRSMVVDLYKTNPTGWENDSYIYSKDSIVSQTDAIIYELHVRDMSIDDNSNIKNKGKYLAFTELDTTSNQGELTGLSHIKELGVNYIHLLPVYDFNSVDEETCEGYNWGYDPINYNVPEGSYSTNAKDGTVRINEFKQMVMAIHNQNIGVIMDVVYNHTAKNYDSHFNIIAPNYFYRVDDNGEFSNGSGCGNEINSNNEMVRRYIVDSVLYWAKEYHIDGFRFDLMGVLDIDTMNEIREKLDEINPNILIYGEGWTGGESLLPSKLQANKLNTKKLNNRIACFSDDIRDGIKGDVFIAKIPGYVNANGSTKDKVRFGITAATRAIGQYKPWANQPTQVVSYVSAHDNYTLHDKIKLSTTNKSEQEIIAMNMLAGAIVLTSQGISFIHAGEELLRSKPLDEETFEGNRVFEENSYKSSDEINKINWKRKSNYKQVFEYYKGLIELRKTHPEFRYTTKAEIDKNLKFIQTKDNTIMYVLAEKLVVIFNPYNEEVRRKLPKGNYQFYVNKTVAKSTVFGEKIKNRITVPPLSATVLGKI